ncbi:helix-turn-helix transcriptional regulator [Kitasatospora sp. NPDC049285]|uniref:helix-turn-helix domain-containing protein n=1 Tax=Kitasatospora sp. NPDC049285 TaxID=3157096 RepID=UPI00344ADF59
MDEMQEGITGSVRALSAWRRESQADLGALLGLSAVTIAQRLNGRLAWTLKDVSALCKHYGLTFDQLTKGPASWLGLDQEVGSTPP